MSAFEGKAAERAALRRCPLLRSAGRRRRRGQRAATITFRSPSALVNYWRKSDNTSPKPGIDAAVHESAFGPKQTSWSRRRMSAFGGKADIKTAAQITIRPPIRTALSL